MPDYRKLWMTFQEYLEGEILSFEQALLMAEEEQDVDQKFALKTGLEAQLDTLKTALKMMRKFEKQSPE